MPPALTPRFHFLVPAAGTGERAGQGGPKQYAKLHGSTVIGHTLNALRNVARRGRTVVVLSPADTQFESLVPGFDGDVVRTGGSTRAASVLAGLQALVDLGADERDWVLVHDAARCLVRAEWIDALIDACQGDPVGGLLALPVPDTLKSERDGRVDQTIDRAAKWQAQTPQMFRLGELRTALTGAGAQVTDEAGAMQAAGLAPKLVPGALENFKLTYPMDFQLAERLLATRT